MHVLWFLLCLFIAQPVVAQNLHTPNQSNKAEQQLDELLGKKKRVEKKLETIEDYAELELETCKQTEHPVLAGKDLNTFCTCASLNFVEVISLEQARELRSDTPDAAIQQSRLMMFAYLPCVEGTTKAMVYNNCINNNRNKYLMKSLYATCGCISEKVSKELDRVAPQYIEGFIRNNQRNIPPATVLINEDDFIRKMKHQSKVCYSLHERY